MTRASWSIQLLINGATGNGRVARGMKPFCMSFTSAVTAATPKSKNAYKTWLTWASLQSN